MSRIGKLPIEIPEKVKVSLEGNNVKVEGPKGKIEKTFADVVAIVIDEGNVTVTPKEASRFANSMHGTARSIIANMIEGVVTGFSKSLELHGVGFRCALKGNILDLALGYSHPCLYDIPEGIVITVTDNTKIKVDGIDKQLVGAVAADLKHYYKPEPFKGKGVRIVGEHVRRKEGKTVG